MHKPIPTSRRIKNREAFLARQAIEGDRRAQEFAAVVARQTRKLSGDADVRQAAEAGGDPQVLDGKPEGQNVGRPKAKKLSRKRRSRQRRNRERQSEVHV